MFVKLFTQILDSSIADNRSLRHFFTDMLLCSDCKGYVVMTPSAIARRIGATVEEVEWGLAELEKPDPASKTPDNEGRRIERLEGSGYGWRILNYEAYRALKDADQMREATRKRVQRHREKLKDVTHVTNVTLVTHDVTPCNAITEAEAEAEANTKEEYHTKGFTLETEKDLPPKLSSLPPFEIVLKFCLELGLTQNDAQYRHDLWLSNGFTANGKKIKDWKAAIRAWKTQGYFPSQKLTGQQPTQQPKTINRAKMI